MVAIGELFRRLSLQATMETKPGRGRLQVGSYPCLLPHVWLETKGLFLDGILQAEVSHRAINFCRHCDGQTLFGELKAHLPDPEDLAQVLPFLVWLDRPLGENRAGAEGERILILAPDGQEGFLSMGAYLFNRRGQLRGTYVTCFSQTTPKPRCRDDIPVSQTTAMRVDETNFCARILGLETRFLGLPEHSERSQAHEAHEVCHTKTLSLHLYNLIEELQPDQVFAPAALAGHPDQRMISTIVQDFFEQGYFSCGWSLYEDFPACCTYLNVDNFLARFEHGSVEVRPYVEAVGEAETGKGMLLEIARSRYEPEEKRRLRVTAQNQAFYEQPDQPLIPPAGALERFWSFVKLEEARA